MVLTAVLYFLKECYIFRFGRVISKLKNLSTKGSVWDETSLQPLDRVERLEFGVSRELGLNAGLATYFFSVPLWTS